MTPVQISPAPQPSGNAKASSQTDSATNNQTADGQPAEPFAKVLSRQVDKSDSPAQKTDAADAGKTDATPQTAAPAVVQPDALAAIMSQIPVEMRGANVTDRAALISTEGRLPAGIDTALPKIDAALSQIDARTQGKATTSPQADLSAADAHKKTPAGSRNGQDKDFASTLKAETKSLAADTDAMHKSMLGRTDITSDASQLVASQTSAASTISQATLAAMTGTSIGNQPAGPAQTIATPLGSAAWGDDFSQKVSWMITQKNQVAELHLNPPNLGPLDVVIKITDNQATALFTSPHAMVRDAVESALPKLRELLADNGIMLGNATVGDQSPREREAGEFSGRTTGTSAQRDTDTGLTEPTVPVAAARRHNGVLDTFA
ncbi:MAG TPA: flagellar hook-length control protein FliK [Gallionella sp.]|nr:flagellar hook-length control protein FliK [Gallionella sp.]